MGSPVTYDREGIIRILRDLNEIVPSFARIGSLASDTPPDVIARIVNDFMTDWDVRRKLAAARAYLATQFDRDELESLLADVPRWSDSARKPPEEPSAPEPPGEQ
jgi:hypothetical protein